METCLHCNTHPFISTNPNYVGSQTDHSRHQVLERSSVLWTFRPNWCWSDLRQYSRSSRIGNGTYYTTSGSSHRSKYTQFRLDPGNLANRFFSNSVFGTLFLQDEADLDRGSRIFGRGIYPWKTSEHPLVY